MKLKALLLALAVAGVSSSFALAEDGHGGGHGGGHDGDHHRSSTTTHHGHLAVDHDHDDHDCDQPGHAVQLPAARAPRNARLGVADVLHARCAADERRRAAARRPDRGDRRRRENARRVGGHRHPDRAECRRSGPGEGALVPRYDCRFEHPDRQERPRARRGARRPRRARQPEVPQVEPNQVVGGPIQGAHHPPFATFPWSAQRVSRRALAAGGTPPLSWGVAPTSGHVNFRTPFSPFLHPLLRSSPHSQ